MQDSRINYVVVGAFVTAMLAAFVVIISVLAGSSGDTDEYFTVYDNVGGVKLGTLVFYEGYQVGQVDEVQPMGEGAQVRFKVVMAVQEGWKIPKDSIARAQVSGLLSAIAIDIRGGKSTEILKPGSEIEGVEGTNIFATLADISAEFSDLSANSIKPLIASLNKYVNAFGATTMNHLPALMDNLEKLSATLERTSGLVEKDVLKPENRAHFDAILANLTQVSGDLKETSALLNTSITNVNAMVENNQGNVNEAMRNLRYTLDTFSRYVDDISQNIDATARNMSEFSRSIRANPGVLLSGKDAPDPPQGAPK
ncbi:MAG: MlaD family protein [Proteobacteria bacterium]|nr:MlaD family protein [Pseudomonadota bacterium]